MKSKLSQRDLDNLLKKVERVSIKAGVELLKKQKKLSKLNVSYKDAQGVVSEADVEAEKFIITELKKLLPSAHFLAEESAFLNQEVDVFDKKFFSKLGLVWCIDPLDGTTNYLNGMDYFGVCIALLSHGEPILSVVHWPAKKASYLAMRGKGAWKKEGTKKQKLKHIEKKPRTKDCVLVTGFAAEKGIQFDREFDLFKEMMNHSRGIRRMGSAAIDLCMVAEGVFDGFWERGLSPWDVAASGLICEEAGLKVSDYEGRKYHPFRETIMCFPPKVHGKYKKIIKNSLIF